MSQKITPADRERRATGATIAREAYRRKTALQRAEDPVQLSRALLTVRAALERGLLRPDDLSPEGSDR